VAKKLIYCTILFLAVTFIVVAVTVRNPKIKSIVLELEKYDKNR
jgi:hypothetical protein